MLKNCPGLVASDFGDARTIRCMYSALTHSCERISVRSSSTGMCGLDGAVAAAPAMLGEDAKTVPAVMPKTPFFLLFKSLGGRLSENQYNVPNFAQRAKSPKILLICADLLHERDQSGRLTKETFDLLVHNLPGIRLDWDLNALGITEEAGISHRLVEGAPQNV